MTGSSTNPLAGAAPAPLLAGLDATFAAFAAARAAEPAPLAARRRAAFSHFAAMGLPTRRDEEWKYTSLRGLDEAPWTFGAGPELELESRGKLPAGVRLTPLREAAPLASDLAFARAFESLNAAFLDSGFLLEIDRKVKLDEPLNFVHRVSTPNLARFPRLIIRLGELAEATVVESFVSGGRTLVCGVTQIELAAGARLLHAKLQEDGDAAYHVASTKARLARDASLRSFTFTLGGKVTRNDLDVVLEGEGAEASLDGFYVVSGKRHVDNHTTVDHTVPHTTSSQLYKGILADQSRAVFNGKVFVRKDAQKTSAYQLNKNLLLSSEAEIDTKPQLEIDADDVKCSHGAAVGPIDADQIFYLQSRSIPREVAVRMLALGFADEVLLRFPLISHRDRLRKWLPS